jgi:hypothetical protein
MPLAQNVVSPQHTMALYQYYVLSAERRQRMKSLYQCGQAIVTGNSIKCKANHNLSKRRDGCIDAFRLKRGDVLELSVCQNCPDFDFMGNPVKAEDRGWITK